MSSDFLLANMPFDALIALRFAGLRVDASTGKCIDFFVD
jgi:hypothetical protein